MITNGDGFLLTIPVTEKVFTNILVLFRFSMSVLLYKNNFMIKKKKLANKAFNVNYYNR